VNVDEHIHYQGVNADDEFSSSFHSVLCYSRWWFNFNSICETIKFA